MILRLICDQSPVEIIALACYGNEKVCFIPKSHQLIENNYYVIDKIRNLLDVGRLAL